MQISSSILKNSVYCVYTVYMSETLLFQIIQFIQTVLIQSIPFSISTDFVYT